MTNPAYTFRVLKDPCPGDATSDPEVREAYLSKRIQIYGLIYVHECTHHGWDCRHAVEMADLWSIVAPPGHEGTYRTPAEIRDEALQGAAYGMWAGVHS